MPQELLPWITGSGGALVVLAIIVFMFVTGKLHSHDEVKKLEKENVQLKAENFQLRLALDTERQVVNDTARAGMITNQLISALTDIASHHQVTAAMLDGSPPSHKGQPGAGLTSGDASL